jgi:tRNA(Ile)-lysidine synthase
VPGLETLDIEALFAPVAAAKKLGLAVSGGPDSLALMLLAHEWAQAAARPALVVSSVVHGLRPAAAGELAMVLHEAERLGIAARGLRWDGPKPETGIQAAARKARYGLMAEAMAADGAQTLLTAHHLGDLAETVLMRFAHGSGIEGLRGMDQLAYVEGCEIFRPLLRLDPQDLAAVVAAAGLTPATDPSNRDRHYERVRWRQIVPALEDLGLELRRFGNFAERMGYATMLVEAAVEDAWPSLVEPTQGGNHRVRHGAFAVLNPLVQARLLGRLLALTSGDRRDPPLGALESLAARLRTFEPLRATTLHGCVVSSDGETIQVTREGPRTAELKAGRRQTAG